MAALSENGSSKGNFVSSLEVESVVQGFVVEDVLVVVFTVYLKACRYVGSTSGACCGVHGHQNEIKVCFFWIRRTIWDEVTSEDDNFSGTIHLTGVAAVLIWSLCAVWFTSCCVSCVYGLNVWCSWCSA